MPLDSYFKILDGELHPRFRVSAIVPSGMDREGAALLNLDELMRIHRDLIEMFRKSPNPDMVRSFQDDEISLLALKSIIARRMLQECRLCENRCRVERMSDERGRCGVGERSFYASEFLHLGEEPELVPSHTVFFTGCTFRCIFCQNNDIADTTESGLAAMDRGTPFDESAVEIIMRRSQSARNLNLVGGNPDQHMASILEVLEVLAKRGYRRPIVWNSNNYMTVESVELLIGVADLHLADFKYGNSICAEEMSGIKKYWEIVTRNLLMEREVADILIRHLVLPGHVECCTSKVIAWMKENLPDARFNLMFQYHPEHLAVGHPVIGRFLSDEERESAMRMKIKAGLR